MVEGIIGFSDILSIAQTIGLVGTMAVSFLIYQHNNDQVDTTEDRVFQI
jgi:hypothetical protein